MKKAAMVLIVISLAVVAWVLLRPAPAERAVPVRDDVTLRSTSAGDVVGFIDAHGARAWLGIPFAAPPVGTLRWRAPQPPVPWAGVREALSAGGRCPQKPSPLAEGDQAGAAVAGQEDCLYLNVWAPPNARDLPVMLWVHGGGNTIGSGDTYIGAALAVQQRVVVITINYRLGPFGWFAHPGLATGNLLDDSGNYGTLDIVRALEWTRDNVDAFGGDPGNVTLFGESAGAFDTLAMMASPLARGLFHRAIVQSGGFSPTPMSRAANAVENGGHPFSATEIVNRLMVADGTVPDREAALALQNDMAPAALRTYLYGKTPDDVFALWEDSGFGMIDAPDSFADGHVLPALATEEIFGNPERHNVVPVILGSNRDEPSLFMAQNPEFVERWLGIFPRLKDEDDYLRRVKYGAMAWKASGVDELADLMTAAGNPDVFAYRFDWDELGSMLGYDLSKALGAAHFLEVPFVFGDFENFPLAYLFDDHGPARDELAAAMMSYWAQFAYQGDPGRGRDGALPLWAAWGEDDQRSLLLDTAADGGIRMMHEKVTRETVVRAIATDPDILDQQARCTLYRDTFRWDGQFDRAEYQSLGCDDAVPAG
ncbi:MAG: carboxylesterase family protein [Pseudomonadales bacterium]